MDADAELDAKVASLDVELATHVAELATLDAKFAAEMATIIAEADAELALLVAEVAALDGKVVSGGPASWDFDVPHFDMAAGDVSDLASCCSDVGSEVHSVLANGPEALPLAAEEALA